MLGRYGWLLLLGGWFASAPLLAQEIPPPLRDWQGWVLHDMHRQACPLIAGTSVRGEPRECVWPGTLLLDAGAQGGRFALQVHVDAPSWVALPGDAQTWPQQVTANDRPAIVLERDGRPAVRMEPGDYRLRGLLPWTERPARLPVPMAIGLVALQLDGKPVAHLERHGEQVTLGEAAATERAADALALRVYRRLQDGVPATLQTRLQLDVAGSAREVALGPALPTGFVATALDSPLPARLGNDGQLHVQLRPGHWSVSLAARAAAPLDHAGVKPPPAPWPAQEVWSYADAPGFRSTRVQGQATDAGQAGVPDAWQALPAFVLDASHGLTVTAGNRGNQGGQGDQLRLQRQLWLDFDGRGISAADHLTGQLRRQQRLDVGAPWRLQHAAQDGVPLLISQGPQDHRGVELRSEQVDLLAGLRLSGKDGAVPAAGWLVPLDGIDATLHLPRGYRLLAAPGADRSPDSWVASWSLLDLFVVALITLLAGRLLGWRWALLAGAFLVLAQHEPGGPRWTLAAAFALGLLLRALPLGRLRSLGRVGALAAFALALLWTLPFAATQLQYALHPQLEPGGMPVSARFAPEQRVVAMQQESASPVAAPPPRLTASAEPQRAVLKDKSMGSASYAQNLDGTVARLEHQDAGAPVQAGGGTPHWDEGNNYRLAWSGPVSVGQTARLVVVPAGLVALLRLVMVLLLAALLGRLAQQLLGPMRGRWPRWWSGSGAAAAVVLALLGAPGAGHAQVIPSQALLDQLAQRLAEAPACAPDCAAVAQAHLQVDGDRVDLSLQTHVATPSAVPLPMPGDGLRLASVHVDGKADPALTRRGEQALIRLDRGVHVVDLHYALDGADSVSLRFAMRPQRLLFAGPGWTLEGVDQQRPLGDSVTLRRIRTATASSGPAPVQSFPPYVRLHRSLHLGVDWTVQNEVERIAPQEGGFSVELPLLPGEHPIGAGERVRDGHIKVTFNARTNRVRWSSRLDPSAAITLTAPPLDQRAEEWTVDAAPMWHLQASGVPPSRSVEALVFQPLPGERLQLAVSRPVAVPGDSLAFDSAVLSSSAGERSAQTTLTLRGRSTRGGEHAIGVPKGAQLLRASRDGVPLALTLRDNTLSLPLLPGAHDYSVQMRLPDGVSWRTRTPGFALRAPVANVDLGLQLPHDRWVLWTWGPSQGPAVLYWSQLVVLLLASWLLARFAPTPLRFHHWLLLGLGFSAFAWSAYALVVAWLLLLGWRARAPLPASWSALRSNVVQMSLAALTVLALAVLISAVPRGLLGLPDMHVAGNSSSAWDLHWFADRSDGATPVAGVFSVSLWFYKLAMLAWALWLANALLGWLRWGFDAWTRGGYWREREKVPAQAGAMPPDLPTAERKPDA